ncbi:MAG: M20/M25/M40 family metallo-hydrolase [Bacteroidota bacterium]
MMKKYILAGAFLATVTGAMAQNVNKLIDQKDVERVINTLAADDMQGRATFTPGIEKAAKFIESEFTNIGLQPMEGSTTGYRQVWAMSRSMQGKTVVNINMSGVGSANVYVQASASFTWDSMDGVTIIKETSDKNLRADMRTFAASGKKTLVLIDPSFAAQFKQMRDRAMAGGRMTATAKGGTAPAPIVYVLGPIEDVRSLEVTATIKSEEMPLFNVAGIIPGKTKPDEYVVFSGHYDHLGIAKGMAPDSIFNGADDDASGTTAVIELAKYYKKLNNNARTLIFVGFCAEEIGEFGSAHFATTVNPDKVIAMFNIEMIGKPSKWGQNSAFITGFERSDFGTILQKNLEGTDFKFYPDPYTKENLFYRSDNASLARVGVPAHTITTDQIDIDPDYHKVTDEVKTLDMANITAAIRAIALSSRTIVSGKDTPTRVAKLER